MSDLAYLRSNISEQLYGDPKSGNVPYNIDSLPRTFTPNGMQKKTFVDNKLKVNFIKELPPEISCKILRMLDNKSLSCAERVSRKWKIMCEDELKQRREQYYTDAKIEGTNAYYDQLWELIMLKIEETYGQRFPF